jgi:Mn2+/Fe2+ NRAMP family transporter
MRRAPVPLAIWSLLLLVLVGLIPVFGADLLVYALLASSAALIALLAAVVALTTRERSRSSWMPLPIPDLSLPAALLAVGLTGIAVGFTVGPWMTYIGSGLTLLALAGLARERRAQQRARRAALRALRGALRERPR